MTRPHDFDKFLDPQGAVDFLRDEYGIATSTRLLAVQRHQGYGVPFVKVDGTVFYPTALLREHAGSVRIAVPKMIEKRVEPRLDTPIREAGLSVRATNALLQLSCRVLGDADGITIRRAMRDQPNLGLVTVREIERALEGARSRQIMRLPREVHGIDAAPPLRRA